MESSTGVNVRRASVSDDTAKSILTLWGNFTDVVQINRLYGFVGMRVKLAEYELTLCTPKGNAENRPIDDIGSFCLLPFFLSERPTFVHGAKIIGATSFSSHALFPSCKFGHTSQSDSSVPYAICSSCFCLSPLFQRDNIVLDNCG